MAGQSASIRLFLAHVAAVSLLTVLASCESEPAAEDHRAERLEERSEQLDDAAISARVAAAILEEQSLRDSEIHVETQNNIVHLYGYVRSGSDAERAERIALTVRDVRRVKDDLVVR